MFHSPRTQFIVVILAVMEYTVVGFDKEADVFAALDALKHVFDELLRKRSLNHMWDLADYLFNPQVIFFACNNE